MTPDKCEKCGVLCVTAVIRVTRRVRGVEITTVLCPRCYEASFSEPEPAKVKTNP